MIYYFKDILNAMYLIYFKDSNGQNKQFTFLRLVSNQVLYSNTCDSFELGLKE